MKLREWLNTNVGRVAELVAVNGGTFEVARLGATCSSHSNRYGRLGLNPNEAFELTYYRGIIDALINTDTNPQLAVKYMRDSIDREIRGNVIEIASPEQQKELLNVRV